jgi:hypothetical protein
MSYSKGWQVKVNLIFKKSKQTLMIALLCSFFYSPKGNGSGFYNGGSSGNDSFYQRTYGSRKY